MVFKFFRKGKAEAKRGTGEELSKRSLRARLFIAEARKSITKAYKEGRIVFKGDGNVAYSYNDGTKQTESLEATASRLFDRFNNHIVSKVGDARADARLIGVSPEDICKILEDLKEGGHS